MSVSLLGFQWQLARACQKNNHCYNRRTLDTKAEHHGKFVMADLS